MYNVYVNDTFHSSSNDFTKAKLSAVQFLNKKWDEDKEDIFVDAYDYINALNDLTNGADTTFNGTDIRFCQEEPKKFSVTYTRTFEDCSQTRNVPFCSFQKKFVCYNAQMNAFKKKLCKELETNAQGNGDFNTMLQDGLIDCLQDTEMIYEVYVKDTHEFHIVEVKELD